MNKLLRSVKESGRFSQFSRKLVGERDDVGRGGGLTIAAVAGGKRIVTRQRMKSDVLKTIFRTINAVGN